MAIIEVENLSKSFGEVKAVNEISFTVSEGEIFGFLGPNGAGKSTTIRMLTGVLKPTSGIVKMFGKNFWENTIPIKQLISSVSETANVYNDLNGMYNLLLMAQLYGISKKDREERAVVLLKKFELYDKRNLKAKAYSKGMKQRLLICMALMSEPKILFLDEPTSGLDVQTSILVRHLIKEYNQKRMTIFLTTHNMDVANELCDRIAIINNGKIVSLNAPEKLKKLFQENHKIEFSFNRDVSAEEIKNVSSTKEVEKTKEGWSLIVNDVNKSLVEIVEFAKLRKLEITRIATPEPSLEEIFLKIINGR